MKKKIGKLKRIDIAKPSFDEHEEKAVIGVLRSGWVAQGPKVAELEKLIADYTNTKYAVAVSSATTALFLSLYILGIGRGDEVIVPSFSFIASANVVLHVGATPVFVDIDPATYNIDPKKIVEKITPRTKAILPVDQVGLPCDLDMINQIAKKYNLIVIEDAACSLGSIYKNKPIGGLSDITCLSFHARKVITSGEGGMILTNNKQWAEKAKILRHQGMSVSDTKRHTSRKVIFEEYSAIGYNFRLSDIQAAVAVEQMKKLPSFLKKRKAIADRYSRSFKNTKSIIPPFVSEGAVHNWQSYVIRLRPNSAISRNQLMQKLLDDGIATRRGVMAIHLEPAYKSGKIINDLPFTESAANETISLPTHTNLTKEEQEYIIGRILYHVKER